MKSYQHLRLLALVGICLWCGLWLRTSPPVPPTASTLPAATALQGAAALEQLKQTGQLTSLQAAMQQARRSVSYANKTPLGRPAWHAPNPAAGYDAYVHENGLSLVVGETAPAGLRLQSLGYSADLRDVAAGVVSGAQQTINLDRGNLREWYVNGAEGLEQGFTLNAPLTHENPAGAKLRLALQVSPGWRAVPGADDQRVGLVNDTGVLLEYGKLAAWDAHGHMLPAALAVEDEHIVIAVDDAQASYPVTIDPIFTQQAKLSAPDAAANDWFGDTVALDGNTAIVGAPLDDGAFADQGSVYVFVRSGSAPATWTFQAKLAAVDGAAGDQFGFAFALRGDTLVVGSLFDDVANADQGSVYVFTRSGSSWTQQQKLTASDAASGDHFGIAVALNGNTFIAGAADDDNGANADQGSAYVFTRSGTVWTQQQKLTASDGLGGDRFGRGVSLDGETALVGAPFDDSPIGIQPVDQGSAYVFTRSGSTWTQQQRLTSSDGAAGDLFGYSVALSGATAIAGAYLDDVGANGDQGSAYVFIRNGTTWTQQQRITASDGAPNDHFGYPVALSGDTAAVGAAQDDTGTNVDQGGAYVFARSSGTWAQQNKLVAADGRAGDNLGGGVALSGDTVIVGAFLADGTFGDQGAAYVFTLCALPFAQQQQLVASDGAQNDLFGYAVALSGDTALVGARGDDNFRGAAYVFARSGTFWSFQQKLTASDGVAGDQSGFGGDDFGHSVALSGDTALVGAPSDDILTNIDQGSAYVFTRSGTTWTQQQKLIANDGAPNDFFGIAVALDGATALVGASGKNVFGSPGRGSAYVFTRNSTTWTQQQELIDSNGAPNDGFGQAVALNGDTLVVGSLSNDILTNMDQGSAHVFTRSGTTWTQQQVLVANDGAAGDLFGNAVALSGDNLVVGAVGDDIGGNSGQGSAYVFTRSGTTWTQQQKLVASDGAAIDVFGSAVALSGDTVVVGAQADNIGANGDQGSAYVFIRSGTTWTQQQQLTANDGAADDFFGISVALSGDTVLIGAWQDDIGTNLSQGSAYIFNCATCPAVTLNPVSMPNALVGTSYNQTITASGGAGPYQFSVSGGALPPGFSLAQGGLLTGTPMTTGTFSFTITATVPSSLCSGSRSYTLTITPPCPTITVNPASLPNGTAGTAYSPTLSATGGSAPYSFAVTSGALPNGLTLAGNGALTGTPMLAGNFNFTVTTTDANGCTGARAYVVTIACPTVTVNPATLPSGMLALPYNQTLSATPAGGNYSFAVTTGALPNGLTLNAASGALTGTPTTNGAFAFTVTATGFGTCSGQRAYSIAINLRRAPKADFDGDGKTDLSVFRPTAVDPTPNWLALSSLTGQALNFSWGGGYAPFFDVPVPGDYDGDGKTDYAIWRGADTFWYLRRSSDGQPVLVFYGANFAPYFDIPTPGDFDGDGKTDIAVFRRSGTWFIRRSSDGGDTIINHGQAGDVPLAADFDGDGKCDLGLFRPDAVAPTPNWIIRQSSTNTVVSLQWGGGYAPYFDTPVPADYDGDGKADLAIWRGADSIWYIRPSATPNNPILDLWGANYAPYFDTPVPADYDGDGKADIAVWRKDGTWFVKRSSDGSSLIQVHGQQGDVPLPAQGVR